LEISNGHISATGQPIHFIYIYAVTILCPRTLQITVDTYDARLETYFARDAVSIRPTVYVERAARVDDNIICEEYTLD